MSELIDGEVDDLSTLRILVCWAGRPGYVPAPVFSPNQLTIYSHHDRERPGLVEPPTPVSNVQDYDLGEALERLRVSADFDLLIVACSGGTENKVRNTRAVPCPRLLMLTDTHHLSERPISVALDYFAQESFHSVVSLYNRDHLKWFRGVADVSLGWHPNLTVIDIPRAFVTDRNPVVSFIGNWRRQHFLRKHHLDGLTKAGYPVQIERLNRLGCAVRYASSLLSFNCSLNGDLNMRVFEVLSAGGCLVTDRLPPQSGLDALLEEGVHYVGYRDHAELVDKIGYYLEHPREAVEIARAGRARYRSQLTPTHLLNAFARWAMQESSGENDYPGHLKEANDVKVDRRRSVYESVLVTQLGQARVNVLTIGDRAGICLDDLAGCARCNASQLVTKDGDLENSRQTLGVEEALSRQWDLVVVDRNSPESVYENDVRATKLMEIA